MVLLPHRYYVALRLADAPLVPPRSPLARRYQLMHVVLRSLRLLMRRTEGQETFGLDFPRIPILHWRHLRIPGCLITLMRSPCPRTPVDLIALAFADDPFLPASRSTLSASTFGTFGALSHGSRNRCLRFAAAVTHGPRKTRYHPAGYALAGWVFHPLGNFLRFLDF